MINQSYIKIKHCMSLNDYPAILWNLAWYLLGIVEFSLFIDVQINNN